MLGWVIEGSNDLLKCYRELDNRVEIKSLPHFLADFRIAALINSFNKRLLSDGPVAAEIAKHMFKNQYKTNELMSIL